MLKIQLDNDPENLLFKDKWLPVSRLADLSPQLLVIVDTEEEFDWNAPFNRSSIGVTSIRGQARLREIFRRFGVRPTYVVDYPVASQPAGYETLRELLDQDECLIGAHLQPWVNLPDEEEINEYNSYPGNLPPELERRKLEVLTEKITQNFGHRPVIYKAGRYGLGPGTYPTLTDLGYQVDLSPVPYYNMLKRHGPDFSRIRPHPYWINRTGGLLSIPLTRDFFGPLSSFAAPIDRFLEKPFPQRLMLRGILSRTRLLERSTLTPEGVPVEEYTKLVEAMIKRGHRIFCLTYHSPSLEAGNTPYVRTEADLEVFISSITQFLDTFINRFGGRSTDPLRLRKLLLERANPGA